MEHQHALCGAESRPYDHLMQRSEEGRASYRYAFELETAQNLEAGEEDKVTEEICPRGTSKDGLEMLTQICSKRHGFEHV